ncbi:hypothetical protein [Microbulbifer sp.]|uniref:hypothetical protein n=1 Tax=Microbulbifer sp. TaxID=1908541 RepID=UPI002F9269A3
MSIQHGTINAELQVTHIPRVENHHFLLNSGLNIQHIRSTDGSTTYYYNRSAMTERFGESLAYTIPDNTGENNFIPTGLTWKYTGKYPVIAEIDQAARFDWKGNIAFNGRSLRTDGMQSAWFPQFYDAEHDRHYYQVTYDIRLSCQDCETLYVNGSSPVRGQVGRFVATRPVEPLLFLGSYTIANHGNNRLLGSALTQEEMERGLAIVTRYQEHFAAMFGHPFKQGGLTLIDTSPVSRKNAWMWVSSPSIVNVSHENEILADLLSNDRERQIREAGFIAHELAHVYFSNYRDFNSDFGLTLNESLAEYLSLIVVEREFGQPAAATLRQKKLQRVVKVSPPSLSAVLVDPGKLHGNFIRYELVPSVWVQLEQEIGRERMLQWITALLTRETRFTDFSFAQQVLREVLGEGPLAEQVIEKYFLSTAYLTEFNEHRVDN